MTAPHIPDKTRADAATGWMAFHAQHRPHTPMDGIVFGAPRPSAPEPVPTTLEKTPLQG